MVDEAVKQSLESEEGERFSFSFAGKRRFKGISDETAVHRIRRAENGFIPPSAATGRHCPMAR